MTTGFFRGWHLVFVVTVLIVVLTASGSASAQKLTAAEHACARDYLKKGVAASEPNLSGCTLGFLPISIDSSGEAAIYKGGLLLAEYKSQVGCGVVLFYAGSYRPPLSSSGNPSPSIWVTDFCSLLGKSQAYYNGLHEGLHSWCPLGTDDGGCEELAVTASAAASACDTISGLLDCLQLDPVSCTEEKLMELKEEFPELFDGELLDDEKTKNFANGLCLGMEDDLKDVDRQAAYDCACGSWNMNNPDCAVPELPPKPGGGSYCDDGGPPSEAEAPDWPIPDCASCPVN